jgi:putative hydrolase of the HAD superfamily
MTLKTIGFDLFGTLLQVQGDHSACLSNLHNKLSQYRINIPAIQFLKTYQNIHKKYRTVRLDSNIEVSNQVELCEILKQFNFIYDTNSKPVTEAIKAYFSPWSVTIAKNVNRVLQDIKKQYTTGVITNFTDTTFVYQCLKKFNLLNKLDSVVISAEIGWRKPNRKIFDEFLQLTKSKAEETLFVGDDVNCDIRGAQNLGFTTALLLNNKDEIHTNGIQPDFTIASMDKLIDVIKSLNG